MFNSPVGEDRTRTAARPLNREPVGDPPVVVGVFRDLTSRGASRDVSLCNRSCTGAACCWEEGDRSWSQSEETPSSCAAPHLLNGPQLQVLVPLLSPYAPETAPGLGTGRRDARLLLLLLPSPPGERSQWRNWSEWKSG